jgi:electron transfer flavoprotein alpha subunit
MAEFNGVLVFGETIDGKLTSITTEILGAGRRLADELQESLSCVLPGTGLGGAPQEAVSFGADKVFVIDDSQLKDYLTETYAAVVEKVVKDSSPKILLFGQTSIGRDLAPRLAFRLGVSVSMDCLELGINPESKLLEQTRSVFGGNARATFVTESFPQIATIRQKAMAPVGPDASRTGEIVAVSADIDASQIKTKVLETVKEEVEGIKLEDAEVVVSGGRGIGSAEGFKQLEELAKVLKGAVGASRPPCDNDWIADTVQIGLTGKIVTPELYIAVAISGASQHLAGCSGSKNIIAINRDAEANIFKDARYGVVGDWKQVLPAFIDKVKSLVG